MSALRHLVTMLGAVLCLLHGSAALAAPPAKPRGLPALNVAALAVSDAHLFVGGFDEGLYVVDRAGSAQRVEDPALSRHINALAWSERDRTLWLGTARGLTRCRMAASAVCTRLGSNSAVHALLLRRDGSLVAGGDAGLMFVAGSSTQAVGKKQAAPYRSVWALAEGADDTLFIGATNGLFWGEAKSVVRGGALRRASVVTGNLPDDWVTALLLQGDQLHVGTYNAGVASFAFSDQSLRSADSDASLGYVNPAGLFPIASGAVAVSTMAGLHVGRLGKAELVATRGQDVTAVAPAHAGGYWVGTRQGLEWTALVETSETSPKSRGR